MLEIGNCKFAVETLFVLHSELIIPILSLRFVLTQKSGEGRVVISLQLGSILMQKEWTCEMP